jgi:hypothetical protein
MNVPWPLATASEVNDFDVPVKDMNHPNRFRDSKLEEVFPPAHPLIELIFFGFLR